MEFDISITYPTTAPETVVPELDGRQQKCTGEAKYA
jgi:hypothetical protein